MNECSADKGLKAIPIRGVSETLPGWSSKCNLGHCSRLEHRITQRAEQDAVTTKGAQFIQNTCTASNNVVDVSHCEVVCKSDAQDRDVLDSFKASYK